jgi:hypothetical protein
MPYNQVRKEPRPVSIHPGHGTGHAIPPAFGYRDQATESVETLLSEELNRSWDIVSVSWKAILWASHIDDNPAR